MIPVFTSERLGLRVPGEEGDQRNIAAGLGKVWLTLPGIVPGRAPGGFKVATIGLAHDPDYVGGVCAGAQGLARVPRPYVEADLAACELLVAGAVEAMRVQGPGIAVVAAPAVHLPGRKAHDPDTLAVFNGLAVVARAALQKGAKRVLVIEGDAIGGRTGELLRRAPVERWTTALVREHEPRCDGGTIVRNLWHWLLKQQEQPVAPGLVVYQASSGDVVGDAPEGCGVTPHQIGLRDRLVLEACRRNGWPLLWTPGRQRLDCDTVTSLLFETNRLYAPRKTGT